MSWTRVRYCIWRFCATGFEFGPILVFICPVWNQSAHTRGGEHITYFLSSIVLQIAKPQVKYGLIEQLHAICE